MARTETTPERAARQIRDLIKDHQMQAGESLPAQRELAHELGLSRASLREALATLETLGMIRVQAGKGAFVADPGNRLSTRGDAAKQAARVYQFRLAIEPYVAGLAAQARNLDHITALANSIEDMHSALDKDDLIGAARSDTEFHRILLDASGNPLFHDAMRPAANSIHENQMLPFTNPAAIRAPLEEHTQILRHIRDRNPSGARDAMHFHVLSAATRAGIAFLRP